MPKNWEDLVFRAVRSYLDHAAVRGRDIPSVVGTRQVFNCDPDYHRQPLADRLMRTYSQLQEVACQGGRLRRGAPLILQWQVTYDIFLPERQVFVEVDEPQHFSVPRLDLLRGDRQGDSPVYPTYFWKRVLPRINPRTDLDPPHRDEQRAYRDAAREMLVNGYGFGRLVRIDQFTLRDHLGRDEEGIASEIKRLLSKRASR